MSGLRLSGAGLDRAAGALVGLAAGDALGAAYEFTVPGPGARIVMRAGGPWELGEWTDDTAQAVAIAEVTAGGGVDEVAIGGRLLDWFRQGPKDVGISTAAVLGGAAGPDDLARSATRYFASHPRGAAGNGSLMRTAAVALAHLGDDAAMCDAARAVSGLTHGDPLATEACVLWCIAIDRAVRQRRLDGVRDGLGLLAPEQAGFWLARLDEAETRDPHDFSVGNGFVVTALQAAWAVISQTPQPQERPARHLQLCLEEAVRIGHDTDTVAAIAGQLLGAYWGASAIPWAWRRHLHGWPGLREDDLVRLAVLTARRGEPDGSGWPDTPSLMDWGRRKEPDPVYVELPVEVAPGPALLLGNLAGLDVALAQGVDAVVSLCRTGHSEVPGTVEHARFWLVDQPEVDANHNLEFVLQDVGDAIAALRGEGKRVYVHCVGGRSRTPAAAATYLAQHHGMSPAASLEAVSRALPEVRLNRRFSQLLR